MLPKDPTLLIALELSPIDLLNLCKSNKRFNNLICNNQQFWQMKLIKDFNFADFSNKKDMTPKQIYTQIVKNRRLCETYYHAVFRLNDYTIEEFVYYLNSRKGHRILQIFLVWILYPEVYSAFSSYEFLNKKIARDYVGATNNQADFEIKIKAISEEKVLSDLLHLLTSIKRIIISEAISNDGFLNELNNLKIIILDGFIDRRIPLNVKNSELCNYITV